MSRFPTSLKFPEKGGTQLSYSFTNNEQNTLTPRKAPKPLSYQLFTLWKQICNCLMYSMAYSVCPHHWRFTWLWKCLSPATVMIITIISNKLTIFAEIQRVGEGGRGVKFIHVREVELCVFVLKKEQQQIAPRQENKPVNATLPQFLYHFPLPFSLSSTG